MRLERKGEDKHKYQSTSQMVTCLGQILDSALTGEPKGIISDRTIINLLIYFIFILQLHIMVTDFSSHHLFFFFFFFCFCFKVCVHVYMFPE